MSDPYEIEKEHKLRVRLSFDGTAWLVKLPHYRMVPDSFEPVTKELIHENGVFPKADPMEVLKLNPTVEVMIPDRIADNEGNLHLRKIRKLYEGQKLWDNDKVVDNVLP
jgi:hypothetical protein